MKLISRRCLIACALALCASLAVAQQAPAVRMLASFSDESFWELTPSPSGRFVLRSFGTLEMYDVATRQSWPLVDDAAWSQSWSPRGDMIAYVRDGDGGQENFIWTLPVDANSGRPRGPAQRVTIGQGECPSFSVDGRWIAFAGLDSVGTANLAIVPATGGPQRVLARGVGLCGGITWSADGRTIYVGPWGVANQGGILKIRVADGTTDVIRSRGEWLAGMTPDRRYLVLVPAKSPMPAGEQGTVIDTTGREVGRFPLPVGSPVGVLGDTALVWYVARDHSMLEVRPIDGGTARRLPLIGESNGVPLWSPDGTRIAFQVSQGGRASVAIVYADGTEPRVYGESDVLPGASGVRWSPDSRFVAFRRADLSRLSLLDVAAGTTRTLLQDDSLGNWRWRADGQAIIHRSRRVPGAGVYETTLDGRGRRLLDWPVPNPNPGWQFVGDSSIVVYSDSGVFLRSLGSGPARRLAGAPHESELYRPLVVVSHDRRWVAALIARRGVSVLTAHQIELFSLETGERTVLDLPFHWSTGVGPAGGFATFLPGDSALLVSGRRTGETGITLYRVPLNGGAPRAVANVGTPPRTGSGMLAASVSPDGRRVAYGVQPEPTTQSLLVVDIRGAIPRAPSRSPRR